MADFQDLVPTYYYNPMGQISRIPYFVFVVVLLIIIVQAAFTIRRSCTARNKKFLILFSLQIIFVGVLQVIYCAIKIFNPTKDQDERSWPVRLLNAVEILTSALEIGILLTTCYGWMVAICTLNGGNKSKVLRKSRFFYVICFGAVVLTNLTVIGLIVANLVTYSNMFPITQLVNHSLMCINSLFLLRKGNHLLVLLKMCEEGMGVQATKLKFRFIFYSTVTISFAGSILQILRCIQMIDTSWMQPFDEEVLSIGYESASIVFLALFSMSFRPTKNKSDGSLLTDSKVSTEEERFD